MTDIDWAGLLVRASAVESATPPAALHRDECVLITGAGGSIGSALTLRMAEQALLACAAPSTRVSCIRLGNVLGSQGSVVGVFLDQMARGENITVTHPDATRYVFTMAQTISLILEAASGQEHAQLLISETGAPTRIVDLAHCLIHNKHKRRNYCRSRATGNWLRTVFCSHPSAACVSRSAKAERSTQRH